LGQSIIFAENQSKIMKIIFKAIFTIATLFIFQSCEQPGVELKKIQFGGEAQGTYYAVTYYANDTLVDQQQIDSLLNDFDMSASIWVEESIISRINNNDPDVIPDEHFIDVFRQAKIVSEATNGAFDITIGPLVNAWGFGFKNKINVDQHVVDSLLPLVNFMAIDLVNGRIVKNNPNIHIDYNAIAQGYSVDLLGGLLHQNGIENYLVDIGGEVLARGNKPDGKLWIVGIEKPSEEMNSGRTLKATLEIKNKAIATSGNYRKFYEVDGIRYSHTIDPETGYPVKHSLLSATVMADSASIADAYATAFMVMGLEKTKLFLELHPELDAYFIYSGDQGKPETFATKKMLSMITEQ
jgi:thiamine biosynthesis lipoprotein